MPDYSKSKIYKLYCPANPEECYIGSTTRPLSERMNGHRASYKSINAKTKTRACLLFEKYGVENCKIELIEYYPCNTIEELLKREGHFQFTTLCVNRCIAGRSIAESNLAYQAANRPAILEHKREYHQANREAIREYQREYYQANRPAILEQTREYQAANREAILEYQREYYQANREARRKYYQDNRGAILAKHKARYEASKKPVETSEANI